MEQEFSYDSTIVTSPKDFLIPIQQQLGEIVAFFWCNKTGLVSSSFKLMEIITAPKNRNYQRRVVTRLETRRFFQHTFGTPP